MDEHLPPNRKVEMSDTEDALQSTLASPDKIDIDDLPARVTERASSLSDPVRGMIGFVLMFAIIAAIVLGFLYMIAIMRQ
jgi:hypothetical protein